jgi:hypothetical protein
MRDDDVEVLPVMGLRGEPVVAKAIHKRMVAAPPNKACSGLPTARVGWCVLRIKLLVWVGGLLVSVASNTSRSADLPKRKP